MSLYDSNQRAMANVALNPPAYSPASLAFNAGGTDLYMASIGHRYAPRGAELLDLNVATHTETVIQAMGQSIFGYKSMVASVNPATGKSVMYEWAGYQDITVSMVDTDPSSPTFNTVIKTLAGNLGMDVYIPVSGAATPDGKYVYVNVLDDEYRRLYHRHLRCRAWRQCGCALHEHAGSCRPTVQRVRFAGRQVAADNLLCLKRFNGGIKVFDISANPLNPTPVTTIVADDAPYIGLLYSFTIVGNRLFAYDYVDASVPDPVWIFNFDRQHNNYSVLGYALDQSYGYGNKVIAVSPDGNLLFVPGDEAIQIFDVNQIVNGQSGLITQLASYHGPAVLAVSPVTGQDSVRRLLGRALRHDSPTTPRVEEDKPVSEPLPPEVERLLEKTHFNSRKLRLTLEP